MAGDFNQERFDRYIKASRMLDEAAELLADSELGYWGDWVPFRDALRMLVRARSSGVMDLIATTGNAILDSAERAKKRVKRSSPRRAQSHSTRV